MSKIITLGTQSKNIGLGNRDKTLQMGSNVKDIDLNVPGVEAPPVVITVIIAQLLNGIATSPLGESVADRALVGFSLTGDGATNLTAINIDLSSDPSGKLTNWKIFSSTDDDYSTSGDNTDETVTTNITATQAQFSGLAIDLSSGVNFFVVADVAGGVDDTTASLQPSFSEADVTISSGSVNTGSVTGTDYSFRSSEAQAIIDRMTVTPSVAEQNLMATWIDRMEANGDLALIDVLVCVAMGDPENIVIDWQGNQDGLLVNAPTHDPFDGLAFNGTSQSVNTQISLSGLTNYTLNSAYYGVWNVISNSSVGTRTLTAGRIGGGSRVAMFQGTSYRINTATANVIESQALASPNSWYACNRTGSTTTKGFKNGVKTVDGTDTSVGLTTQSPHVAAHNNQGTITQWFDGTLGLYIYGGGGIDDADVFAGMNDFMTGMAALG